MMEIVKIEKLVFGGQALGRLHGGAIFIWNALPGEEVEIEIVKKKKNYFEALAKNIIKPSPYRIEPKEDHFLSCSPWQILDFKRENFWKKMIASETYKKIGKLSADIKLDIVSDDKKQYGYRNKIEYSFAENNKQISLAFFQRGKKFRYPIFDCQLSKPEINQTAHYILDWINKNKIPMRSLKSLIIRSNELGETIAALFIKDVLNFESYPKLDEKFLGFHLFYSTHKSPASVITDTIYASGRDYLVDKLNNVKLKFGLLSFFQINIPIFKKALDDILKFLGEEKFIVDYYSGVGSISLPLAHKFKSAALVDNNEEAIGYANGNIKQNKINNCKAKLAPAEKLVDLIDSDKIIILDPPRAGLHKNVIKKILKEKPLRIIYLSCNISTQARDMAFLSEYYKINFLKLYNFFPRTPHIEALCVLDKK